MIETDNKNTIYTPVKDDNTGIDTNTDTNTNLKANTDTNHTDTITNTLKVDDMPVWTGFPASLSPVSSAELEYSATAGTPLEKGEKIATRVDILPFLYEVKDPEIQMNIVDLGLLYALDIEDDGNVSIKLGLTSAGCPFADILPAITADTVSMVKGVGLVKVEIVWEPAWSMEMMSDNAKLHFDLF